VSGLSVVETQIFTQSVEAFRWSGIVRWRRASLRVLGRVVVGGFDWYFLLVDEEGSIGVRFSKAVFSTTSKIDVDSEFAVSAKYGRETFFT